MIVDPSQLRAGQRLEVEWPCHAEGVGAAGEVEKQWLRAEVLEERSKGPRKQFLLRFVDDGGEAWNSLRQFRWRLLDADWLALSAPDAAEPSRSPLDAAGLAVEVPRGDVACRDNDLEEVLDTTGFVHSFELEPELLAFCDELHTQRELWGDKTRGDSAYGEPLHGGLVSVLVRREALPKRERELYNALHQRCIREVPAAWPDWLRKAAGKGANARPSQDLRLLQYKEGAKFKRHVDSGWPCQALIYLNEDFGGGHTEFPNLPARIKPRRGKVLLWRSICVGHRPAVPGSLEDHPALHVANPVYGGTKRVVSVHLVVA